MSEVYRKNESRLLAVTELDSHVFGGASLVLYTEQAATELGGTEAQMSLIKAEVVLSTTDQKRFRSLQSEPGYFPVISHFMPSHQSHLHLENLFH